MKELFESFILRSKGSVFQHAELAIYSLSLPQLHYIINENILSRVDV